MGRDPAFKRRLDNLNIGGVNEGRSGFVGPEIISIWKDHQKYMVGNHPATCRCVAFNLKNQFEMERQKFFLNDDPSVKGKFDPMSVLGLGISDRELSNGFSLDMACCSGRFFKTRSYLNTERKGS